MAKTKYGKYIISEPKRYQPGELAYHVMPKNKWTNGGNYLSDVLLKESALHCDIVHVLAPPDPQPFIHSHVHKVDEILIFAAMNAERELGAEVEITIGAEMEKHSFSKTSLVYLPKGLKHGPLYFKDFKTGIGFYMISVLLQPDYD